METLTINSFLKYATTPIAMVDSNLNFLNYSNQWIKLFVLEDKKITGLPFFNVIKNCPIALKKALKKSLLGHEHRNEAQKFLLPNGDTKWLKWNLIPFEESKGNLGGTIIFLEDVTDITRKLDISDRIKKYSKIGGWEFNLITNETFWDETVKNIHEVSANLIPDLETGIHFFKKGEHRDKITELFALAIEKGIGWDAELIITTQKSNEKWVRVKAETEVIHGKCVRIYGTFQDVDVEKKLALEYNTISERLKIATDTAGVGIWEFDLISTTFIWDKTMYQIYGLEHEKFTRTFDDWANLLHPDDKKSCQEAFHLAISGKNEINLEFRIILPTTGNIKNLKAIATTLRNDQGTPIKMIGCNWDLTELKRTKLKLKKTVEFFNQAFDNSAVSMALMNLDGGLLRVNQSFCKSLGYSENELLQLPFQEFTHQDDLDLELELYQELIDKKRDAYQVEKRCLHKKGHYVHTILTVTSQKNIDGDIINFVCHFIDITARKAAELQVKETIKRLNVATEVANIGIWTYHLNSNTVDANENMYNIYSMNPDMPFQLEEWIGRIHIEDRERIRNTFAATVQEGKPFITQYKVVNTNNQIIYIAAFGEAQKDEKGNIIKVIGSNLDITALRQSELKLIRSNESFSEIFENSAIGMAIINKDNYWLKVNKSFSNSLGYTEDELQKMTVTELTHPDDLEKGFVNLNNGKDSYQVEQRYFHKNGHIVYVVLNVTLVHNLNNEISHSVAQILDITERFEVNKKLNSLVKVTKAQNESLMNFAHIVSHNLRSHSSNLNMLTDFIAKEQKPEEIQNLNEMISKAALGLSTTVNDLNDVIQIQTGALDQLKSVNLLKTIERVKNSILALIEEENAVLSIHVSKAHFVNAVPSYLESILLNLFTNALKYRAPDRAPVLEISSTIKDDIIHLTFTDNGQGIDLNRYGDKIFGMYKTFHTHKDAKGIGLFITKNQIDAMRGKIYIESEVGQFTTMHIELNQG